MADVQDTDRAVLAFIDGFVADRGYAPSFREIGAAMGMKSSASVAKVMNRLHAAGLVDWDPHRGRTLRTRKGSA